VSRALALAALASLALAAPARTHEARPAYLGVEETAPGRYTLQWRTPMLSGTSLPVALRLPDGVRDVAPPLRTELPGALLERRTIEAGPEGLAGRRIDFPGLESTLTDVIVRVELLDGTRATALVRPSEPWLELAASRGALATAGAYVLHGVEHIALGFDHLLFVLGLILIVPSLRALLLTITAFTVAHSLTLALATLGLVHVPGPPVDALIALSIVLLAAEIVRAQRGEASTTARRPWAMAFAFGLLHGLGFAGALTAVGLPEHELPLALLSFNAGVELAQLGFLVVLLPLLAAASAIPALAARRPLALRAAAYGIGSLAALWLFERVAAFA
jgi:hypothetical protein